jgi:hypothetical protein
MRRGDLPVDDDRECDGINCSAGATKMFGDGGGLAVGVETAKISAAT